MLHEWFRFLVLTANINWRENAVTFAVSLSALRVRLPAFIRFTLYAVCYMLCAFGFWLTLCTLPCFILHLLWISGGGERWGQEHGLRPFSSYMYLTRYTTPAGDHVPTLYTPYCILYTLHFKLYTLHSILFTLCALQTICYSLYCIFILYGSLEFTVRIRKI